MRGRGFPLQEPPDDESRELIVHRMASLLPMFYVALVLGVVFLHFEVLRWPQEIGMTVPMASLIGGAPMFSDQPLIQIAADGTVSFGSARFAPSDADLEPLCQSLRDVASRGSAARPLLIQPDAESRYQRVIEVLSAIRRANVRFYEFQ